MDNTVSAINKFTLKGKVALLVGNDPVSTPSMGKALAKAGANVFVTADTQLCIDKTLAAIEEHGNKGLDVGVYTTTERDIVKTLGNLDSYTSQVDILINNNHIEFAKPFTEVLTREWDTVISRNLRTTFLFCREVGKRMLHKQQGRIVNILSGLAERGLWNSAAYCATQGAVLQLTRALALEWARQNIRVNAIGTGWYSLEEHLPKQSETDTLSRYIPLRRKGTPNDISSLLIYLSSDACDYTTGQVIYVDGGLMSHA